MLIGKDVAEWTSAVNTCWFAARTLAVRRKYRLTIDRAEAAAVERILTGCPSTNMVRHSPRPLSAPPVSPAIPQPAGIEARVTAHSGRVGLASELTARGASTTEVMLAGNWKTARMVAHYSAGATAEHGAVRKYL